MTLGLPHILRRRERILMDSRCTVTRGESGTTVHSNLPCIATPSQRATRTVEAGGEEVTLHLDEITVPLKVGDQPTDVKLNDVVTITKSRDPRMVGRFLTIREVLYDDFVTNRRLVGTEGRV